MAVLALLRKICGKVETRRGLRELARIFSHGLTQMNTDFLIHLRTRLRRDRKEAAEEAEIKEGHPQIARIYADLFCAFRFPGVGVVSARWRGCAKGALPRAK